MPAPAKAASPQDSAFVKRGLSFGVLPSVAYDSDLGFQYGVLSNLYWYGDGGRYPAYDHSLYLECSRYVAGTMLCRAYYDSPRALRHLSPHLRLTADFTLFRDLLMDFYGFNGHKAVYHSEWVDDEKPGYVSHTFYAHHRRMIRLMGGVRYGVPGSGVFFQTGVSAFNMECGPTHLSELRRKEPDVPSLYDLYRQWGGSAKARPAAARTSSCAWARATIAVTMSHSQHGAYGVRLFWPRSQAFSLRARVVSSALRSTTGNISASARQT